MGESVLPSTIVGQITETGRRRSINASRVGREPGRIRRELVLPSLINEGEDPLRGK